MAKKEVIKFFLYKKGNKKKAKTKSKNKKQKKDIKK
jgi:hypothetical protein